MAPVKQRHLRISRLDGVHRPDIWPPVLDGEPPGVVVKDRLERGEVYLPLKRRREGQKKTPPERGDAIYPEVM